MKCEIMKVLSGREKGEIVLVVEGETKDKRTKKKDSGSKFKIWDQKSETDH